MKLILGLFLTAAVSLRVQSRTICATYCDGITFEQISSPVRNATSMFHSPTTTTLRISDEANMAFTTLEGGASGDKLWVERSFDGGITVHDGQLGLTTWASGDSSLTSPLFNIDEPWVLSGMGAVRACIETSGTETHCTEWVRSLVHSSSPMEAAVTGLMQFYKPEGLWQTVGWWNAANCLTAMIDYFRLSGMTFYLPLVEDVFAKNLNGWDGNYTSDALDDTAWWALAWIDAYDLTGNRTYLDMAVLDAEWIVVYRDNVCGDGIWWNIYRNYKNAITNELYIKIAAQLHNRLPGDTKYLQEAVELWDWFVNQSGMINSENLINDGLHNCQNNNDTTWTYNQGVILGAAVELAKATNESEYLTVARRIADAVIASAKLSPNGILREPCEDRQESCNGDQTSFKGIFLRNLGELNRAISGRPYQAYLEKQLASNYQFNRNIMSQYGLNFIGPFDKPEANRQHTAVDAFVSILP